MTISIYQADAFTQHIFGGNPAAVCPLEEWLPDALMQNIALENNLAETAFIVPENDGYYIRWFTPAVEVDLCGHATLAAAHVFFTHLNYPGKEISFHSRSGLLKVTRQKNGQLTLDFPADRFESVTDIPAAIGEGLGITVNEVYKGKFDYMVVVNDQQTIEQLQPDFKILATLKSRGVLATARGNEADFVSRCFFPQSGIDEDPVTGSAHTLLTPYWAGVLGKNTLKAIQLSARKGYLDCELSGDRVLMSGYAVTYMKGEIIA
ncbi:PhzF family phenazine biosynthesis protein [Agriterribacter sp.]|uniref:PhzF family phenazine biosynthesis protein n=1 Tax=Agriterribacter sp. TaxID=2821509 RepID=UPI002BEEA0D2|nr:PhzF family phenazine biosynthesis protein [Agriterribacter sp.]HRO46901.1 PhzF family phenazine biosynthesis protein [Agriterribacter sp.]HRQ17395.1 PhzF family phenazine biosynthesis protein [Agriterribacter sp.]